ncbi:hypothetical protein ACFQLX_04380 [Streptomyces polyrhachis]|uniref:Integral membrane protein n=1 Tax=Streptomyces polyrhachis TaxID=1282885 RepID=A0ABW2GCH4_9ACTN
MQPLPQPQPPLRPLPSPGLPTTGLPAGAGAPLYRETSDQQPAGGASEAPASGASGSSDSSGPSGSSGSSGSSGEPAVPAPGGQQPPAGDPGEQRQPGWGSQWSRRQPPRRGGGSGGDDGADQGSRGLWGSGRTSGQGDSGSGPGSDQGAWGRRPEAHSGQRGQGTPGGPARLRWDPTDPNQRRARYALLSGMWAFFFALFSLWQLALLLGVLALYWGVSALRNKAERTADPDAPARTATTDAAGRPVLPPGSRPQKTAATMGIVSGGLALLVVAGFFAVQLHYSDYYECREDALTQTAQDACRELPTPPFLPEDQ